METIKLQNTISIEIDGTFYDERVYTVIISRDFIENTLGEDADELEQNYTAQQFDEIVEMAIRYDKIIEETITYGSLFEEEFSHTKEVDKETYFWGTFINQYEIC